MLDKEPDPIADAVIRTEARDDDGDDQRALVPRPGHLRVPGRLLHVFPATDRRDFERVEDDDEFDLVRLTLEQVRDRIEESRIRKQIGYVPKEIFVEGNQIRLMRCISDTEIAEQRRRLLEDFRERTRAEILAEQGDELREQIREELEQENGETPTDEEVGGGTRGPPRRPAWPPPRRSFGEEELPQLLEEAIAPLLRFDLDAPASSRRWRTRTSSKSSPTSASAVPRSGGFTVYYRGSARRGRSDNLLSLPRYAPLNAE